jgi:hypothetical protein
MRKALQIVSWLALAGIVVPPFLYFHRTLAHDALKTVMLVATIVWFVTTPFWMSRSQT